MINNQTFLLVEVMKKATGSSFRLMELHVLNDLLQKQTYSGVILNCVSYLMESLQL